MKILFLLMVLTPLSVMASVDLQVVLVSNHNNEDGTGTMVLEMQAKSDAGDETIGQFRAKFFDDNTLNQLSPVGTFSDQLFTSPDYSVYESFSTGPQNATLSLQYNLGNTPAVISGTDWTKILTLSIDYNLSAGGTTTFIWSTRSHDFAIDRDDPYADLFGSTGNIPADVPLDPTPMPVELTKFTANLIDEKVSLNWVTATEVNNYGFEIQRQKENSEWENIGFVNGHGNSNSVKYYSFIDNSITLTGCYSYRLKQIDNDGTYEYSDIVEVNLAVPRYCELNQNYPNPFNPSTTITYSLRNSGNVRLIVYNLQGEVVRELVNEYKEPGFYSISFDGDQLASGIYYYKLISDGYREIKKMMLLK